MVMKVQKQTKTVLLPRQTADTMIILYVGVELLQEPQAETSSQEVTKNRQPRYQSVQPHLRDFPVNAAESVLEQ